MSPECRRRLGAVCLAAVFELCSAMAFAGATPEEAFVIIDPTDPDSMYVGNYYKNARNIPDSNVLYMRSAAQTYDTFIPTVQNGFLGTLQQRNLQDHVDYVVLAPLNVFTVLPPSNPGLNAGSPLGHFSITAAFELSQMSNDVLNSSLNGTTASSPFGGTASGAYPSGNPAVAFHAQQPYLYGSPSSNSAARQFYISSMLGYTRGPVGNTVSDLLSMIDRSVAADGSMPAGSFYFMNNTTDNARNARAWYCGSFTCSTYTTAINYVATANSMDTLGSSAQVLSGILPPNGTSNVLGVMSGFANANIAGAQLGLVPGAFADELTSWAAVLDGSEPQTTVQSWIAAGASGSAGAVEEPDAYVQKFPSPDFHKYYYQGMSLGEAYLRSVETLPFQMLLYGDPLTRPFAYIPSVNVASPPSGPQSGLITITPTATTANPGATISSYTLLVDGVNMGTANPGQSLSLDTGLLNDGRHDLRVLAYDSTPVQNVGRWIGALDTSNYAHGSTLSVSPASGSLAQPFTFSYTATGGSVQEVRLVQNGRVIASSTAPSGTLIVYGQNLGAGTSTVKAEAWYSDDRLAWSVPVTLNVTSTGTPAGVTPVAYSYSKVMSSTTGYVLELPASYDVAPGAVTYTVLNSPYWSTVLQQAGPYLIIQPQQGANGSETLQFQASQGGLTSNIGTVTLIYTSVSAIQPPTGSTWASGRAWNGTQPVGIAEYPGTTGPIAGIWSGSGASWVSLNPAGAPDSAVYAANGGQIAGSAGGAGGYWTAGTASSWVDLSIPGSASTIVAGVYQGQQVGYAYNIALDTNQAWLWNNTAASAVNLSPPGSTDSGLQGTDGTYQIGWAAVNGEYHAGMWTGSAASFVDVNPSGASSSFPYAVDAAPPYEAVGYAIVNGASHAGYWISSYGGTPGTWVDLNPTGATSSGVLGTYGNIQVGYATINGASHAGIWIGNASSWIDLSASLPPYYMTGAAACAIRTDANSIYVLGNAERADFSATDVVVWKLPSAE